MFNLAFVNNTKVKILKQAVGVTIFLLRGGQSVNIDAENAFPSESRNAKTGVKVLNAKKKCCHLFIIPNIMLIFAHSVVYP